MSPAGVPVSLIVRAPPPAGPNAPGSRCGQSGYAAGQSVSVLQDTGPVGFGSGQAPVWSPAKQPVPVGPVPSSRQKPQNDRFWLAWSTEVMVFVPVVSAKAMGREPMSLAEGGGQSWLVGKFELMGESAGVQAAPSLSPPWHLLSPAQMGQAWTPTEQNPPPVHGVSSVHTVPTAVPPTQ